MRSKYGLSLVFLICLFGTISSCYKELEELGKINGVKSSPEFVAPLLDADINIKEIYNKYSEEGLLQEASDHFLTLVFQARDSLAAKQLVKIPNMDVEFETILDAGTAALLTSQGTLTTSVNNMVVLNPTNNERLKSYRIKTGELSISVISELKHDARIITTYPTITRNGVPLVDTTIANYSSVSPVIADKTIILNGFDVDLSNGGTTYNTIPYTMTVLLNKNPNETVDAGTKITMEQEYKVNEYSLIRGYLGKINVLDYHEENMLDIFDPKTENNVVLKDPKIIFNINNGIGMPLTGKITNLRAVSPSGAIVPVRIDPFKDTFTLVYPTTVGDKIQSQYVVDKTNSNLDSVMSTAPQYVMYDMEFWGNYNEVVAEDNFILWDNAFNVESNVTIPLDLKVFKYEIASTQSMAPITESQVHINEDNLDVSFGQYGATLSLFTQNYLPIGSDVQINLLKSKIINGVDSYEVVLKLPQTPFYVPGCIVDANGNMVKYGEALININVSPQDLQKMVGCDKYKLVTNATTSKQNGTFPFVKVYSNQYLRTRIGFKGKGDIRFKF